MTSKEKLIKELEEIRVRLTQIYMILGNPKDCRADMTLSEDIGKFNKKQEPMLTRDFIPLLITKWEV